MGIDRSNRTSIECKWVFKKIKDYDGNQVKRKKRKKDFNETVPPLIGPIAATFNLEIEPITSLIYKEISIKRFIWRNLINFLFKIESIG